MHLTDIETPALVLDRSRLQNNLETMSGRARELGVDLRPHLKTAKCAEIAWMATAGHSGGVTVSTLKEAEYFLDNGFRDITYAVGIAPSKLDHVGRLQARGARITLILDSPEMADAISNAAEALGVEADVLIEIDCGAHRGGVPALGPQLMQIARIIALSNHLRLKGVLTHAGHAYAAETRDEIRSIAEDERRSVVEAAERLETEGHRCAVRSVGSTPTALFAEHLKGVTEMRSGVYMFMDLYQAGLGVCGADDMAVSILTTVIGRNDGQGYGLVDAGALALSMDTSAARFRRGDIAYGQVRDLCGRRLVDDVRLDNVHQEHGWIRAVQGRELSESLSPGRVLRIYPNHVCMAAAPYDRYHVVDGGTEVVDVWSKTTGW